MSDEALQKLYSITPEDIGYQPPPDDGKPPEGVHVIRARTRHRLDWFLSNQSLHKQAVLVDAAVHMADLISRSPYIVEEGEPSVETDGLGEQWIIHNFAVGISAPPEE